MTAALRTGTPGTLAVLDEVKAQFRAAAEQYIDDLEALFTPAERTARSSLTLTPADRELALEHLSTSVEMTFCDHHARHHGDLDLAASLTREQTTLNVAALVQAEALNQRATARATARQ